MISMSRRRIRFSTFVKTVCLFVIPGLVIDAQQVQSADSQPLMPADSPGRVLSDAETKEMGSHVWPDGRGLPPGQGSTVEGQQIYTQTCAGCHGSEGEGASAPELVGENESLTSDFPDRGVAAMWPYAPTLFEYIRRAMPPQDPWSLSVDQTYAVLAYVFELNGLLEAESVLDSASLSKITLPNRDGFINMYKLQ